MSSLSASGGQEVALAYLSVVPSMQGTLGGLQREMASVQRLASKTSRNIGRDMASQLGKATVAARTLSKQTSQVAQNLARGFKTGATDGLAASFGNLAKVSAKALGNLTMKLPGVQQGIRGVQSVVSAAVRPFTNFVSGFKSSTAAASTFTGVMGNLGGKTADAVRSVSERFAGLRAVTGNLARSLIANNSVLSATWSVARNVGTAIAGVAGKIAPALGEVVGGVASFAGRAASALAQIPGKIADVFRGPATAAVTAGLAAVTVALTKGLGRLNAIDTAQAKLRGLGNDASQVDAIMKDALASVKGTAYGLDEAATTAAGAVAAGIKPGKELEGVLKTVANVAAATGTSMSDMGALFNQVAAGGKAYTMQIKQVANAGLPIWQKLSEVLNVTTEEAQKMASEGKIDFATFAEAATLAAGTVAEEMGNTLPGALQNLWAAVSRTGANLWKGLTLDDGTYTGIYSKLKDLIQAITNALGPIEEMATKVGDVVGRVLGPVLEGTTALLNRFAESGKSVTDRFKPLMSVLAPFGGMLAALGAGGLAGLLGGLGPLAGLLGPLPGLLKMIGGPAGIAVAGLAGLANVSGEAMQSGFVTILGQLPKVFESIGGALTGFMLDVLPAMRTALLDNLPILIQGVVRVVQVLVVQIVKLLPLIIESAVTLFSGIVHALTVILPDLIQTLIAVVRDLAPVLVSLLPTILQGALTLFMGIVDALTAIVPTLIQAILDLLPVLVDTLVSLVPQLIQGALTLLMALVDAIVLVVPPLLEGILTLLPEILGALVSMIPALIEGAVQLFTGIVEALPIIIPALLAAVIDLIPVVVETLVSMIGALVEGAVALFTGLIDALPIVIPALVDAVIAIGPQLVTAIIDMVPLLFQAGKDLIAGLIGGIGDMAAGAVEAVTNLGGQILGGITSFFGISSPSKVMAQIGGFLDQGLAGGIGKGAGSVAAMAKMTGQIEAVTARLQKSVAATAQAVAAQVNQIIQALQRLMGMMAGPFQASVTQQLQRIATLFRTVLPQANQRMIQDLQRGLASFQAWFGGSFKNGLTSTLSAIRTAFLALPGAVSASWAKMKAGTAIPANYVLSTVYMGGIRAATNQIAKAVGMSMNLPSVARIGGYASGTAGPVLPGYTPGRDVYRFYNPAVGFLDLSGGEGILRPEVVDALGAGTINAWNASRGRAVDTHAFASGGIVNFLRKGPSGWGVDTGGGFLGAFLGDTAAGMRALVSDPAKDYAGRAGGGMVGRVFGQIMVDVARLVSKAVVNKAPSAIGGGPPGAFNPIGWQAMSAIIRAAFPGARVSSAYRPGAIGATGVPSMHGVGRAIDIVPPSMEIFDWLLKNYRNSYQILYSPAGGRQIYWAGQQRDSDPINKANHWDHIHWAMAQGGIVPQLFDSGGWLQPGLTLAENRTGRPEPVFTGDQLDRMGGPRIENVYVQVDASTLGSVRDAEEFMSTLGWSLRHAGVS